MDLNPFGIVVALVVGLIAITFIFSDLGPGESATQRILITAVFFLIGGAISGAVARPKWFVAGLCAWSSVGMGLFMLVSKILTRGEPPYWSAIWTFIFIPLMVAVLGGFVGARLAGKFAK